MYDVIAILMTGALFVIGLVYIAGCDRLKGGAR